VQGVVDETLRAEREIVDEALDEEREAKRTLLEAERIMTDRDLAREREDTDRAVDYTVSLLQEEQIGHQRALDVILSRDEYLSIVSHDLRTPLNVISVSATLLAGCGGNKANKGQGPIAGEKPQQPAPEPAESDVADSTVLNNALDLENQAVAFYTEAMNVLRGANLPAARQFRDHERAHVAVLTRAIKTLRRTPDAAKRRYAFPRLRTENDVLRFGMQLENGMIGHYIDALPRLNTPALRAEVASIFAVEAEHLAFLNGALRERSAPTAFVTGQGLG